MCGVVSPITVSLHNPFKFNLPSNLLAVSLKNLMNFNTEKIKKINGI